jgi:Bacterial SH3 domain.
MAKRVFIAFLIMALFILAIPSALAADKPVGYGVVNNPNPADRLNLRESPSTDAKAIAKYYNGTKVSIQSYRGEWAYVVIGQENGDITGYMQTKFLDTSANQDKVQSAWPTYIHRGALTLYDFGFGYARETFTDATVQVLGFSDTFWHVQIGSGAIARTGVIKPGDKRLVEHQAELFRPAEAVTAIVNNPDPKDRLHLRQKASTSAETFGKFYNGLRVQILDANPQAKTWVQVIVGDANSDFYATGYMMTKFLAIGSAADKVADAFPKKSLYSKAGNVTVRAFYEKPTKDVLGTFKSGTEAKILGIHADYIFVEVEGVTGIVSPGEIK